MFVSGSGVVLQFARNLVRGLRGDDVLLHTPHLRDEGTWRPLLRVADLVLTDGRSTSAVRAAGHSSVVEFRIVTPQAIERLRVLLKLPRNPSVTLSVEASRALQARPRASHRC
jgi:hypothetical protein